MQHHSLLSLCGAINLLGLAESVRGEGVGLALNCPLSRVRFVDNCRNANVWRVVRGGGLAEDQENRELDQYIEQLVASVDTSEVDEEENIAKDPSEPEQVVEQEAEAEVEAEEEEKTESEAEAEEEEEVEPEIQEVKEISLVAHDAVDEDDDDVEQKEVSVQAKVAEEHDEQETETIATELETVEQLKKRTKRKRKRTAENPDPTTPINDSTSSTKASTSMEEHPAPAVAPYCRPNAVYRFLLGQGRIGHAIVMVFVMLVEWIQTYIPTVVNFLSWILLQVGFGGGSFIEVQNYGDGERTGVQGKVNAQYAAFVSADGRTVRGKQQKKLAKQADQKAVEQLRRVGSVKLAKYRHVSLDFMQRHGIGPYRGVGTGSDAMLSEEISSRAFMTRASKEEEESDVDWVVEALSTEPAQEERANVASDISVKPSVGLGVGSSGASLSVGVELGFGSTSKRKKKRSKSMVEAVTEKKTPVKVAAGPRASDRDGGGGFVGRLRSAVGSNIPSSLLGAYPGDAVPPSEAGSADGVIVLARKYGYGDWSDDEGEDAPLLRRKRRKKKVPKVSDEATGTTGSSRRRKKKVSKVSIDRTSIGGSTGRKKTRKTSVDSISSNKQKRSKAKRKKRSKKSSSLPEAEQSNQGQIQNYDQNRQWKDPDSRGRGSSLSVGLDFSVGTFGTRGTPRTSSTTRRSKRRKRENGYGEHGATVKSQNTSPRSTSTVELLTRAGDSEQRKKLATAEKRVRLPLERTKEALGDKR